MGHYMGGDWGFQYPRLDALASMAFPLQMGGVGLGTNGLELRWLAVDEEEDCEDIFLGDLPPEAASVFQGYPQDDNTIVLPVGNRRAYVQHIVTNMRRVQPILRKAWPESERIDLEIAPTWRLAAWEIEPALDLLRRATAGRKLSEKLTREGLRAEAPGSAQSYPESKWLDRLEAALDEPLTLLLLATTWLVWHVDEGDPHGSLRIEDDSQLYSVVRGRAPGMPWPRAVGRDQQQAREQVLMWARPIVRGPLDEESLRERRLETLAWCTKLPLDDAAHRDALSASAHAWGKLGQHGRAIEELSWALLSRPSASLYGARGYHKHLAGDLEGAIRDYSSSLELELTPLQLTNRAEAFLDLGRHADCIVDAQAALGLQRDNAEAKRLLAKASINLPAEG